MKRALMVLAALVLTDLLASGTVLLPAEAKDGAFGGGDGSAANPYIIEDVWDLQKMDSDRWAHYALANDIDASTTATWNSGAGFVPIGRENSHFSGSLDGRNHTISHLYINRPDLPCCGLIASLEFGASLVGVKLSDVNVTGNSLVGGLAGENWGIISYCSAVGAVLGYNYSVGGLVGENKGSITSSSARVSVVGYTKYIGGLVGSNEMNGKLSNSSASGNVWGKYWYVGGLVGRCDHGEITDCHASGLVTGKGYVGGLFGSSLGSDILSHLYATGDVSGDGAVGGLGGYVLSSPVVDSYSTGNVTGAGGLGGLVGDLERESSLSNSHYNIDEVHINGGHDLTAGGIFHEQYIDWFSHGLSLNITVNRTTLIPAANAYEIASIQGLRDLLGYAEDPTLRFRLSSDLDLSAAHGLFIPYLAAEFDGDNHTVSNFRLELPSASYAGLIGFSVERDIRNLGVVGIDVSGKTYVGGLVGGKPTGSVVNCHAAGTVVGYDYVGGLVGQGSVTASNSVANVTGEYWVGGLVGWLEGDTVTLCYAGGNVKGYYGTGGLVGLNQGTISDSYATGKVQATYLAGGLVASNRGKVLDSYASGKVLGNNAGGLVGAGNDGSSTSGCFWDNETTGISSGTNGTPRTTGEMKTRSTFTDAGWDFTSKWFMVENVTYPLLRWQDARPPTAEAGPDQELELGADGRAVALLDGSGSTDDYYVEDYTWDLVYDGSRVVRDGTRATFTFQMCGQFNVTLNVTDPGGNRATDSLTIVVKDVIPPHADAGPDLLVDEGTSVALDGRRSTDNLAVSDWCWTFTDGMPVELHGAVATYLFGTPGTYVVTLEVTDAAGNRGMDTLTVTVRDVTPPVAEAGPDQVVDEGTRVVLDAGGSWDNVGIANWTWDFAYGIVLPPEFDGHIVLDGETAEFTFGMPGIYHVRLTVRDAAGNSHSDFMNVTVNDIIPPTAHAGEDRTVDQGTALGFDASLSWDNSRIINYTWTFGYGFGEVVLYGERPSFTFDVPGSYEVILKVTDTAGYWDTDTMSVTVRDATPPLAEAGPDQIVDEGAVVTFDGAGSSDNVGVVNFTWTVPSGEGTVALYGSSPSFRASMPGTYSVRLNVTDSTGLWDEDVMTLTVRYNSPPVAVAGTDRTVPAGSLVILDGSSSTDDSGIAGYAWAFTYDGQARSFAGASVQFTFERGGRYEVVLTVTDSAGELGNDTVIVTVVDTGRVFGTVLDGAGRPVAGATVELVAADGRTHSVTTPPNGSFSMDIAHGAFTWRAAKDGYRTVSGNSSVVPMDGTELDFSEQPLVRAPEDGAASNPSIILLAVVVLLLVAGLSLVLWRRKWKRPS